MKLTQLIVAVIILILLVSNYLLIDKFRKEREQNNILELKLRTLEGDIDVLVYDLDTSRDSVRILRKNQAEQN